LLLCLNSVSVHITDMIGRAQKFQEFNKLTHVSLLFFVAVPLHLYLL